MASRQTFSGTNTTSEVSVVTEQIWTTSMSTDPCGLLFNSFLTRLRDVVRSMKNVKYVECSQV